MEAIAAPPETGSQGLPRACTSLLKEELREVEALLESSERAQKAVAERAELVMSRHEATERAFALSLDGAQNPHRGGEVDHSLLFHLRRASCTGTKYGDGEEEGRARSCGARRGTPPGTPADEVVQRRQARTSKTEANDCEEYHRFCARRDLLNAMDASRSAEQELTECIAAFSTKVREAQRNTDSVRVAGLEASKQAALHKLERKQAATWSELQARFVAYETRAPSAPGHEARLRELGLDFPSPAEIMARVEAEYRGKTILEGLPVEAPAAGVPKTTKLVVSKKTKKETSRQAGAWVATEMAATAAHDPTLKLRMHELPADPRGVVDVDGKPMRVSECVAANAHAFDLNFPALDSYRRAEHDTAPYFMPGYRKHLAQPHHGKGGFWSSLRAETRLVGVNSKKGNIKRRRRTTKNKGAGVVQSDNKMSHFEHLAILLDEGRATEPSVDRDKVVACSEALGIAVACARLDDVLLDADNQHASLIATALSQLLTVEKKIFTPYACQRFAIISAKSCRGHRLSFESLTDFCATAADLERAAIDEAVGEAIAVANRADAALATIRPDHLNINFFDCLSEDLGRVAKFALNDVAMSDAVRRGCEVTSLPNVDHGDTILDARNIWAVVDFVASEAREVAGAAFPLQHEEEDVVRGFFQDDVLHTKRVVAFVRFAILRAVLCARRDERRYVAAVEQTYGRLVQNPPIGRLQEEVKQMIADGVLPAAPALAILEKFREENKHEFDDLHGLNMRSSARKFLVDVLKPRFDKLFQYEYPVDSFLLHASAFLAAQNFWQHWPDLLIYVAIVALLEPFRAAKDVGDLLTRAVTRSLSPITETSSQSALDSPKQLALLRALRHALLEAAGSDHDFDAALQALAGRNVTNIDPAEAAALFQPFTATWGPRFDHDAAASRAVAVQISTYSQNGQIDADTLRRFVHGTTNPDFEKHLGWPLVAAQSIIFVAPSHFAHLSIFEVGRNTWQISAKLFPGEKNFEDLIVDTTDFCRDVARLPDAFLCTVLLQLTRFDPDGSLAHPLLKRPFSSES